MSSAMQRQIPADTLQHSLVSHALSWDSSSDPDVFGAPCSYTACIGVPQYLCHRSMALVTMASVFSCGIWKENNTNYEDRNNFCFLWAIRIFCHWTHAAQKLYDALRPGHAHQHNLVAEQNLQGHKHKDLTGATDHLVPNPENRPRFILKMVLYKTTLSEGHDEIK